MTKVNNGLYVPVAVTVKSFGFDDLIDSRKLLTLNELSVVFTVSEVVKKSIRTSFDVPRSIRFVV